MRVNRFGDAGRLIVVAGSLFWLGTQTVAGAENATGQADSPHARKSPAATGAMTRALADFNRGAALLEQYKYAEATQAFEAVLRVAPNWLAARYNLGVANLNLQGVSGGAEYLDRARETFEKVLQIDPKHLYARFSLGIYYAHVGANDKALACFQAVHQSDPEDLHVAYKYAEALIDVKRPEEAIKVLESIVKKDYGFISAIYRLGTLYVRSGQRGKAVALFQRFRELNAAELATGSFAVGEAYATAGKYYLALGADSLPLLPSESVAAPRVVFSPELGQLKTPTIAWQWGQGTITLPGMAAGDVDADGDLDVCLTGGAGLGGTSLWLNDGAGGFVPGPKLASQGISPSFGDADNDGDLDLWLGCAAADQYFENDGKGVFQPGKIAALTQDERLTLCARLFDIDSDGDLDFAAFRLSGGNVPATGKVSPAACSMYSNNRDGSVTDVAAKLGLDCPKTPLAAVVYDDFDNDRDLDLVLLPAGNRQPICWVNERLWKYQRREAPVTGLSLTNVVGAATGDPDRDGDRDLLLFTGKGVRLFLNGGHFQFTEHKSFFDGCGRLGGTNGQFADMDNDGDLDIVIADARRRDGSKGPAVLLNDWPRDRFLIAHEIDPGNLCAAVTTIGPASCLVADFSGNGRNDVLVAAAGTRPILMKNVTPGGHWIGLDLRGSRPQDKTSRSNNSAIGARVEVKSGTVFQQFQVGGSSGPVAATPLRIHAGLGPNSKVDWLRIVWPDGVLQAELELPANQVTTITEMQRKVASCPHLFAWNGQRFEFVADFGGMGGLGYLLANGAYARPDPTEYIPVGRLEAIDGEYVLQVLEPLEEVVYFDEAKLIAVDHPLGTEIHPNEMMAVSAPPPAFEVFCVGRKIDVARALDHRGVDVTAELARIDRRYAGATQLDRRFAGFAQEHAVELDFADRLGSVAVGDRLILFLHGWVEYGYSSTQFAASQAGARLQAPSIAVRREGRWVELFHEVGYPAGLQHMMTLDVTGKVLPGDRVIRITSNMALHWDRIFLAVHQQDVPLAIRDVSASGADLHFRGYPRQYSPDGRQPNLFDYGNIDRAVAWQLMAGNYTRYGEVAELLHKTDDCYVIMSRGEEVTLRFPAAAFGPVPAGCRRSFLVKTDSFCKDMDLYTAWPDTVEPLPFHAMSGYPYGPNERYPDTPHTRALQRRYNTRPINLKRVGSINWGDY